MLQCGPLLWSLYDNIKNILQVNQTKYKNTNDGNTPASLVLSDASKMKYYTAFTVYIIYFNINVN